MQAALTHVGWILLTDDPSAECTNSCQVGECAYVVTDADAFNAAGGLDEGSEYEACEVRKQTAIVSWRCKQ